MGLKERWNTFFQNNICATEQSEELSQFLGDIDAGKNELIPSYGKRFVPMYLGTRDGFERCRVMLKWDDNLEKSLIVMRRITDNTFSVKNEGFFLPTDTAGI